ncbi:MAG: adenylate/guanylate cyclase domain-containing protein [Parvibaculaceae bacterium]
MATTLNLRENRQEERLGMLFARAERDGVRLQFWLRSIALAAVALFIVALNPLDARLAFILGILFVFFLSGLAYERLVAGGFNPPWLGLAFGAFDIVLLTVELMTPTPFDEKNVPIALYLREGSFQYLLLFICLSALTLAPRLPLWLGAIAAVSWGAGIALLAMGPETVLAPPAMRELPLAEMMKLHSDPHFLDPYSHASHILIMLITALIIAAVVWRSRQFAMGYIRAERARSNLARHFSPNVVDELANADEPFGPVRRQEVGVLFADIVGFTNFSEEHPPDVVFELLKEFHRRMEQVVFDSGGTVDNYIGDCIMATFGVPRPGPDDAAKALGCALAMHIELTRWNQERAGQGQPQVDVRIGVQYGPVILGAIGSERILSFATVGDTCNVASRLQVLCRELDAHICAGGAVVEAARRHGGDAILRGFVDRGDHEIRGRSGLIEAWVLPRTGIETKL